MSGRAVFRLVNSHVRENAARAITQAEDGYFVTISPPTRSLDQNAKLHALLTDIVKSGFKYQGRTFSLEDWKAILVSAHGIETKRPGVVIPGLAGEFVTLREPTSKMSVERAASLITFIEAFCDQNAIPRRGMTIPNWLIYILLGITIVSGAAASLAHDHLASAIYWIGLVICICTVKKP